MTIILAIVALIAAIVAYRQWCTAGFYYDRFTVKSSLVEKLRSEIKELESAKTMLESIRDAGITEFERLQTDIAFTHERLKRSRADRDDLSDTLHSVVAENESNGKAHAEVVEQLIKGERDRNELRERNENQRLLLVKLTTRKTRKPKSSGGRSVSRKKASK